MRPDSQGYNFTNGTRLAPFEFLWLSLEGIGPSTDLFGIIKTQCCVRTCGKRSFFLDSYHRHWQ